MATLLKIIGYGELMGKLSPDTIKKPYKDGIKKAALKIEGVAKKATPVDTGRLRSSITHDFKGETALVGTGVEYAQFIEFGSRYMQPRHMEGGSKILGTGPFTYAIEQTDLSDVMKEIGSKIEARWSD